VKGFSSQSRRIERPRQSPKQEIVAKVTNPAAQPWRAIDNIESEASDEAGSLSRAHLAAKCRFTMHRNSVRVGSEMACEQSQGVPNPPIDQSAPGNGRAVARNRRQLIIPQMQFDNGIARPNAHVILEDDAVLSGAQSNTEDAVAVIGIFVHSVAMTEQPFKHMDCAFEEQFRRGHVLAAELCSLSIPVRCVSLRTPFWGVGKDGAPAPACGSAKAAILSRHPNIAPSSCNADPCHFLTGS
jgi:hypothetical protein